MKHEEFLKLQIETPTPEPTIYLSDLNNFTDRTLLYGYTTDRQSHHVYLKDDRMHLYVYGGWNNPQTKHEFGSAFPVKKLIPNKRLYPECCDYEFCLMLQRHGFRLPFTNWSDREEKKVFWGELAPLT